LFSTRGGDQAFHTKHDVLYIRHTLSRARDKQWTLKTAKKELLKQKLQTGCIWRILVGIHFSDTSHLSGDLTQNFTTLLEKDIFLRSGMTLPSHSL